jgi:hypothetical protein
MQIVATTITLQTAYDAKPEHKQLRVFLRLPSLNAKTTWIHDHMVLDVLIGFDTLFKNNKCKL